MTRVIYSWTFFWGFVSCTLRNTYKHSWKWHFIQMIEKFLNFDSINLLTLFNLPKRSIVPLLSFEYMFQVGIQTGEQLQDLWLNINGNWTAIIEGDKKLLPDTRTSNQHQIFLLANLPLSSIENCLRCSYFHTPSSCVSGAVKIASTSETSLRIICCMY